MSHLIFKQHNTDAITLYPLRLSTTHASRASLPTVTVTLVMFSANLGNSASEIIKNKIKLFTFVLSYFAVIYLLVHRIECTEIFVCVYMCRKFFQQTFFFFLFYFRIPSCDETPALLPLMNHPTVTQAWSRDSELGIF